MKEVGCVGTTLASMVIIFLLYVDYIIIMIKNPYDLSEKLKILKHFYSYTSMTINNDKTKVMMIKSKKNTCANSLYDYNSLEEVTSYKYLKINLLHNIKWNYHIEKRID